MNRSLEIFRRLPLFFSLLACAASADDTTDVARFDIVGNIAGISQNPVEFDIEEVTGGEIVGAFDSYHVSLEFPADNEWKEGSVTIRPHKTGNLHVLLMGPWRPVTPDSREIITKLINFDDFRADGAEVRNGGFESMDEAGVPRYFVRGDISGSDPEVDTSNRAQVIVGDAYEGQSYIRVWHNSRIGAAIPVVQDTPVIFRFYYRLNP